MKQFAAKQKKILLKQGKTKTKKFNLNYFFAFILCNILIFSKCYLRKAKQIIYPAHIQYKLNKFVD